MKKTALNLTLTVLVAGLALPLAASGADENLEKKIEQLSQELEILKEQVKKTNENSKELETLKGQVKKVDDKSIGKWLTIGGDYRFRFDSLHGEIPTYYQYMSPTAMPVLTPSSTPNNDSLMTNRFGLNLKAKATEDVTVTSRLLMYKTTGNQTADATNDGFFADRSSVLDGTIGHVPSDNTLRVDQVFATWSNIADQPMWFSVGRRPSTGACPCAIRLSKGPWNGSTL